MPMAFELRQLLSKTTDVMAVNEGQWFNFLPSNPWVAVNWRKPEDIRINLAEVFSALRNSFQQLRGKAGAA